MNDEGGGDEAARVEAMFTRSDGSYRFARWERPLAPAVFGTDAAGTRLFEAGLLATARIAGLEVRETDPDLGVNFLVFVVDDWRALMAVPHLKKLIPDLRKLVSTLQASGANQYRIFGFEGAGPIRICITLIRMDAEMAAADPQTVALSQSVMGLLLWSDHAFLGESPIAIVEGAEGAPPAIVKPFHARLLAAAYDARLPAAATDPAHARDLAAVMAGAG